MAITKTLIGAVRDTNNNASIGVTLGGAITADTACLAIYFGHNTSPTDTATASGGGVTWTKRTTVARGNNRITMFTADGVPSPSGTTITFDNGMGAGTANDAFVFEMAGAGDPDDWAFAVADLGTVTSIPVTLGITPAATDYGIAAVTFVDTAGDVTWTGSFTEDDQGTHASPNCITAFASDSGSPPATVTASYSGTAANAIIGYVAVSEGLPPPTPPAGTGDTDDFTRSVSNGWGTSTFAGQYDQSGTASQFSVVNGIGYIKKTVSGTAAMGLYPGQSEAGYSPPNPDGGIDILDVDVLFAFRFPVMASDTSGDLTFTVRLRCQEDTDQNGVSPVPTDDLYFVELVSANANDNWTYSLQKLVTNSASSLTSGAFGDQPVHDEWWWIRAQAVGTNPTTLRFRMWRDGTSEPGSWFASTTDSESVLQNSGGWGSRFTAPTAESAEMHFTGLTITEVSSGSGGVDVFLFGGL